MVSRKTVLKSTCLVLFLAAMAKTTAPLASAGRAVAGLAIADKRQVFIDRRLIEQSNGVQLVVHKPYRTGQIVIRCEQPWEESLGQYHSTLRDGGTYHLWYTVNVKADSDAAPVSSIAYARSSDGINWEKPNLGLVEVCGTRKNNIVLGHGFGGLEGATHGCMVFLDPHAPSDEKFRLVSNPQELGKSLQIFSSADGIHWKLSHRDIMKFRSEKHHLDSQNVIFWDDRISKYVAYVRRNLRPVGSQGCSVARAESTDLRHFADVEDCPTVLGFDTMRTLNTLTLWIKQRYRSPTFTRMELSNIPGPRMRTTCFQASIFIMALF